MKILYLGSEREHIINYLKSLNDTVIYTEKKISIKSKILKDVDLIVSYGYRHIIKKDVVEKYDEKIINLHISYLPWNRGSDPNLWSFIEDTPKGVTIHYIDDGIDTGDILAQEIVEFSEKDTLRTSYDKLSHKIEALFIRIWADIRNGQIKSYPQFGDGCFHKSIEKEEYEHLLAKGWDTPITQIIGKKINK